MKKKRKKRRLKKEAKIIIFLLIMIFIIFTSLLVLKIFDKEETPTDPVVENPEQPNEPQQPEEPKDPFVAALEQEKYYIPDNLQRYIAYNDGKKTTKEIVSEVNCNLDYEYYTNTKPTDLTKGNLILVNKYNYLNSTFEPVDKVMLVANVESTWSNGYLANDAYVALKRLFKDSAALGYNIMDTSPYRSYSRQESIYNRYVDIYGVKATDEMSARPGFSEHQTGLATDVIEIGGSMDDFGYSDEFEWMKNNAHKYGFILRYPKDKEHLTGYIYEPWHYRYVGVDVATYIYENDIVFEEYYAYFCEYKKSC